MRPSRAARRSFSAALLSIVAIAFAIGAARIANASPSGDELLARAARAEGLNAYSVPIHFDVRMVRPIPARSSVEGVAYFKSPAKTALAITKAPPPIGHFFQGSYDLDMVPQTWASKYHVSVVTSDVQAGVPVYVLHALPVPAGSVDQVLFTVRRSDAAPLSAKWLYRDGSSIAIAFVTAQIATWTLPRAATVAVRMPQYAIDADATYGEYALNALIPDDVFRTK